MNESFLSYRHYRYLKLALLLVFACAVLYLLGEPLGGRNGGTWAGYVLGGIAAFLILLLLWYGVRKRQFHSSLGMVRGWLSAHVYLGVAVVIIATLHCAFQFGWNIHTVAYALLVAVVLSGLYGIFTYVRYPVAITKNRAELNPELILEQIAMLERQCLELADSIGGDMHQMVLQSFQQTRIGGGVWEQLRGRQRKSTQLEQSAEQYLRRQSESLVRDIQRLREQDMSLLKSASTVRFVAGELAAAQPGERVKNLRQLMEMIGQKRMLADKLNRDIRHRAKLQFWLYIHVPLSLALLAAVIAHVISVFYYW